EWAAVQRDSGHQGWTDALVGRALAASRIAAGFALGRTATQRRVGTDAVAGEGKLIAGRSWPRRNYMAVSSSATAEEIEARITALPAYAQNGRRELLEPLQSALTTFTKTQYARDVSLDSTSLDAALNQAVEAARALASERLWPKPYLRRWFSRGPHS